VSPRVTNRSAELCDKNDKSNIAFSGSQDKSVAAANTFMGKILKSGWFNSLAKFSGAHNIASSALIALFLAGLLRPAATVALPGKKDKDDKLYAAGHSMASAIMGFIFSTIVTSPLDSGSKFMLEDGKKMNRADFNMLSQDEIREKLKKECFLNDEEIDKCIKENNADKKLVRRFNEGMTIITSKTDKINDLKRQLKAVSKDNASKRKELGEQIRTLENHIGAIDTSMRNVVDWGIAIPRSALTIAMIPIILKYLFRLDGNKAAKPDAKLVPIDKTELVKSNHVSMKDFTGGHN